MLCVWLCAKRAELNYCKTYTLQMLPIIIIIIIIIIICNSLPVLQLCWKMITKWTVERPTSSQWSASTMQQAGCSVRWGSVDVLHVSEYQNASLVVISPSSQLRLLSRIQSLGDGGTIRRRVHKTLLRLTEHGCLQLAMYTQWGPVSVICSRCHVHIPVRESQSCIQTMFSPPQGVTHWHLSALLTLTPCGDGARRLAMLTVR